MRMSGRRRRCGRKSSEDGSVESQKGPERILRTESKRCTPPSVTPRELRTQTLEETKEATREATRVRVRERDPREGVLVLEAPLSKETAP